MKIFANGIKDNSVTHQLLSSSFPSLEIVLNYDNELEKNNQIDLFIYFYLQNDILLSDIYNAINDSNIHKNRMCVVTFINSESNFTSHQKKSLEAIGKMVSINGGNCFTDMTHLIDFINIKLSLKKHN